MRVYVVEASGKGGLIHYDYHLCRALQRSGVDTTLVTSTAYELRDLAHEFRVIEFLRLWDPRSSKGGAALVRKLRRGLRGIQYVYEWIRLVRFLRRERPDVVLFGEIRFGFERFFLQMLRGVGLTLADIVHDVRVYDTSRDSETILAEDQNTLQLYNRIYGLFDALFVHDRTNYDLFLDLYDIPAARVHEIPLGTNEIVLETEPALTPETIRAELGVAPGRKIILFFGTITKYKGLEDLLLAFPGVLATTDAHLVVAGFPAKDVDPAELKALVAAPGVAEHVSWVLDYVPNDRVASLMDMSDVVAFPYRAISQSAVIQIAYACGKPVVATRAGGLPDVVEEGQSGLLVPPEDPAALSVALNRILADGEMAARMGARARVLAETTYSWRNVAERIKAVFDAL